MKKEHYIKLFTAAVLLSVVIMLPDYIVGAFGITTLDMPMWGKVVNIIYLLGVTSYILYRYGTEDRERKDPDQTKGYHYGKAFAAMASVVVVASIPVAALTYVLRNFIYSNQTMNVTLFGLWASSLITMLFLGGMSALLSAAYVKRNPIKSKN